MCAMKIYLFLLIICSFIEFYQCGRWGGGKIGGSGRGSYHPPSRSPSFHPSQSYHRPSYHPSPSYKPSYTPTVRRPNPTSRPSHTPTVRRQNPTSRPSYYSTARPSHPQTSHREPTISRATARPINSHQSTPRPGPTPPPYYRTTARPKITSRTTVRYPTVGSGVNSRTPSWNLPSRSGSAKYPQGPPSGPGYYNGPKKVVYKNNYNYHYPGYYSLPVAHPSYAGYYQPPIYHYSSYDTGSTVLGLYLGYSLGRLSTPTYSHYSYYDGYRPRYDHYEVHHYYHNRDSIPVRQEIQANTIVGCVGDTTTVCPANTTSLCTSTGALMCVAAFTATEPCLDNRTMNCIKSTITCVNNSAPECKNSNSTSINIPCVSTAQVHGNIKLENNTIIGEMPANNNSTFGPDNSNTTVNTNSTDSSTTIQYSTKYPITTTPTPEIKSNSTSKKRRGVPPNNFCVTIVAVPAEKKKTAGEEFFENAKDIATNFIESAWGL